MSGRTHAAFVPNMSRLPNLETSTLVSRWLDQHNATATRKKFLQPPAEFSWPESLFSFPNPHKRAASIKNAVVLERSDPQESPRPGCGPLDSRHAAKESNSRLVP